MTAAVAVAALLVVLGVRLPFALAGGTLVLVALGVVERELFPLLFLNHVNSFTLLAVPMYLLAGAIMTRAGLGVRIFAFAQTLLRGIPGSLGHVSLGATLFMAGMSGSSAADVGAVGSTALPAAERLGYRKDFIAGIIAAGGTLGILIPPSLTMILYGAITNTSVVKLFTAGILPAVVLSLLLFAMVTYLAPRRSGLSKGPPGAGQAPTEPYFAALAASFRSAFLSLLTPLVVLGGIYSGIVTPTEAGALAVVYTILVGALHRSLSGRDLWHACLATGRLTTMLFVIIAAASVFGQAMTLEGIPDKITGFMVGSFGGSRVVFLLMVNLLFFVLGMFLESFSIMVMMIPLLFPTAVALGVHPAHFAVIVTVNIELGLLTPPYGTNLFTVAAISGLTIWQAAKAAAPYLAVMAIGLLVITYWPWLSLALLG